MAHAVIPKQRLRENLASMMGEYRLAGPAKQEDRLVYKEIKNVDELVFTDDVPYMSPKEFLFPRVDKLMTFTRDEGIVENLVAQGTIIFGAKPCDLETVKILTAIFSHGQYTDPYFVRSLENTIFIGVGCISEKPGCFCSKRGVDRSFSSDCDLFLTDVGDCYSLEYASDRGKALCQDWGIEIMEGASPKGEGMVSCSQGEVKNKNGAPAGSPELLEIKTDEKRVFKEVDWDTITEKCLGCGICTYICPTCHCFAFKDVSAGDESSRYRLWDSCMYPKFTLHASGHNPRVSKKERFRQRVMHKFVYIPNNHGMTACTGCGRCIRSCPVGMNINTVVSHIMEELK